MKTDKARQLETEEMDITYVYIIKNNRYYKIILINTYNEIRCLIYKTSISTS